MRYEAFKAAFEDALRESRLPMIGLRGDEVLDLRSTDRRYKVHVEPLGGQDAEPFHVTATISWRWDSLLTARAVTKEEDMLTTLFGREGALELVTERPYLRVDIKLSASLEYRKLLAMPSKAAWAEWIRETMGRLERIEPLIPDENVRENDAGDVEILAWRDLPKIVATSNPDGDLLLESVSIEAGQLIEIPRTLDVGEEADEGPEDQLRAMFHRVRASLLAWMQALTNLKSVRARPKADDPLRH